MQLWLLHAIGSLVSGIERFSASQGHCDGRLRGRGAGLGSGARAGSRALSPFHQQKTDSSPVCSSDGRQAVTDRAFN